MSTNKQLICAQAAATQASTVTLLDYGAGNVRSLRNAIRYLGFDIKDVQKPEDVLDAEFLVFLGVGAFATAIDVLHSTGMDDALCQYIGKDRPFLGICLELQLLFESSEENGSVNGLGLIPGVVGRFDSSNGCRVPHISWNVIRITKDLTILDEKEGQHVYFVHSYRAMPSDANKEWISSTCNHGENFITSIGRGNIHGVQFHLEKSEEVGFLCLRRFLDSSVSSIPRKSSKGKASKLAKRVIACLDVRANDKGDVVVTKGDQYDVRNLDKPVELTSQYYLDGADEVSFLNITGFRDFPLGDLPMLQVLRLTSENVFAPLTVGGGIRDFTDGNERHYSSLEVASEHFRSYKISIGSDAVFAAEANRKTGESSLEQISPVYGNQGFACCNYQMEKVKFPPPELWIPKSRLSERYRYKKGDKVPEDVDWGKSTNYIIDQGEDAICWALSVVAVVESLYHIESGKLLKLSVQELIDNCCERGNIQAAFEYMIKFGISIDTNYPYHGCKEKYDNTKLKIVNYEYVPLNDEMSLKKAVAHHPVCVFVDSQSKCFQEYSGGIYEGQCTSKPDHAMVIVGYGSENGDDYWKIKNSYGQKWGDNGHLLLRRNRLRHNNSCCLCLTACYAVKTILMENSSN